MRIEIEGIDTVQTSSQKSVVEVLESVSGEIAISWAILELDDVEIWTALTWLQSNLANVAPLSQEVFTKELADFRIDVMTRDWFQVPVDLHKVIFKKDLENMTAENSWFVGRMGDALMLIPADDSEHPVEGIATLCDYNFGFTYSSMPSTFGGVSLIQISDRYALSIPSGDLAEVQEPKLYALSNENRVGAIEEFLENYLLYGMAALPLSKNEKGAFTDAEWSWMNSPSRNWNLRFTQLDDEEASKLKTYLASQSKVFEVLSSLFETGGPRWLALLTLSVRDQILLGQKEIFESYLSAIHEAIPSVESALAEDGIATGLDDLNSVNRMLEIVESSDRYNIEHPLVDFLRDVSTVLEEIEKESY